MDMSSSGAESEPAVGPRLHRFFPFFDPEAVAVVTILLGLFQLLMTACLYYLDSTLPKLFQLPLVVGPLIVAAGSLTMASEKSPSRQLLRGCAVINMAGLLGALVALCLYSYSISSFELPENCEMEGRSHENDYHSNNFRCPMAVMKSMVWCVVVLLLFYDILAAVLQSLVSVSALKALRRN